MKEGVTAELSELVALKRWVDMPRSSMRAETRCQGLHAGRLTGSGMLFSEVRNYQAGDDIRRMDWRVTARTGKPHIKLYEEERELPVMLVTGFSPSMYFGTRVAFKSLVAARLTALLAWTAVKQGDRPGALLYSQENCQEFKPLARAGSVLPILSSLCKLTRASSLSTGNFSLKNALKRLNRVLKPGGSVVITGDFYDFDEDCKAELSRLSRLNKIWAYQVVDALEMNPPKPGLYPVIHGHVSGYLDSSPSGAEDYRTWCESQKECIQAAFKDLQIACFRVHAGENLGVRVRQTYGGYRHA